MALVIARVAVSLAALAACAAPLPKAHTTPEPRQRSAEGYVAPVPEYVFEETDAASALGDTLVMDPSIGQVARAHAARAVYKHGRDTGMVVLVLELRDRASVSAETELLDQFEEITPLPLGAHTGYFVDDDPQVKALVWQQREFVVFLWGAVRSEMEKAAKALVDANE